MVNAFCLLRLHKSSLLQPVQSPKFDAGDSVELFRGALLSSLMIACQTTQSLSKSRCFDAIRKTKDGIRCCTAREELDIFLESELMFCGLKSILNLIHSPMFCKQIFKFYHLRKYNPKIDSVPEVEDESQYSVIGTEVFKKFFKQALQFSLVRSPLNEFFSIADLERCLSVLHCKVVSGFKDGSDGKLIETNVYIPEKFRFLFMLFENNYLIF